MYKEQAPDELKAINKIFKKTFKKILRNYLTDV